jgi:hypothetical protein
MEKPVKFLAKFLLFGLILSAVLWLVFFVFLPPDYRETFSIIYQKQAYLDQAKSPKVILLGGSNVLYGVDSALLEQRLGRPVIDLALQAGIPLTMQMNQVEARLKPGDLIVIIPEYDSYVFPDGLNPSLARLLEVYPKGITQLDSTNLRDLPDIIKIIFQDKYNRVRKAEIYQLPSLAVVFKPASHLPESLTHSFSPQGDLVAHLDQSGKPISSNPFFDYSQLNPRIIEILNDIGRRAALKGAAALLTFPSGRQTNCTATSQTFTDLFNRLKKDLAIPMVGTPTSYCFPDSYFFDTSYHLLRAGRQIRTLQMADDLAPFLK